jgi:polyhydroxybutyrate depolymerase
VRGLAIWRSAALLALFSGTFACDRGQATTNADGAKQPTLATAPTSSPPKVTGTSFAQPLASAPVSPAERLDAPLHLPPRLAPGSKAPLLLVLHGLGASAEVIEKHTELPAFASQHGIAWLAPNGPLDRKGRRFWDAGASCCNFDRLPVDHVAALAELLQRSLADARIDRNRVYVAGYSNGGFMAHRLACERPDLMRGIASVAGTFPLEAPACKAPEGLRVLQIHGDADAIVTYQGGHLFNDPRLPQHASVQKTGADWGLRLGCAEKPTNAAAFDLDAKLPGNETQVLRYNGCARGAIEVWTVTGGNHYIGLHSQALEALWKFLNR